jgi:hypothetical protein
MSYMQETEASKKTETTAAEAGGRCSCQAGASMKLEAGSQQQHQKLTGGKSCSSRTWRQQLQHSKSYQQEA